MLQTHPWYPLFIEFIPVDHNTKIYGHEMILVFLFAWSAQIVVTVRTEELRMSPTFVTRSYFTLCSGVVHFVHVQNTNFSC